MESWYIWKWAGGSILINHWVLFSHNEAVQESSKTFGIFSGNGGVFAIVLYAPNLRWNIHQYKIGNNYISQTFQGSLELWEYRVLSHYKWYKRVPPRLKPGLLKSKAYAWCLPFENTEFLYDSISNNSHII